MVSVPVLSMTMALTRRISSKAVASFINMFFSAALPMPTIKAVGVASPKAHGQAMTSTETAERMALGSMAEPPMAHQRMKVKIAMPNTVGTKIRAILSAVRCTGAFEPWACCTIWMMLASMVFSPTASALKRNVPCLLTVPANTWSPCCFNTGIGSPEIMLSSTCASPSMMLPSTGIFSPALTSMVSPFCKAEMGVSVIMPSTTRCAVLGVSPISERMAEAVPFLAFSSSILPVSTKVMIITEASK